MEKCLLIVHVSYEEHTCIHGVNMQISTYMTGACRIISIALDSCHFHKQNTNCTFGCNVVQEMIKSAAKWSWKENPQQLYCFSLPLILPNGLPKEKALWWTVKSTASQLNQLLGGLFCFAFWGAEFFFGNWLEGTEDRRQFSPDLAFFPIMWGETLTRICGLQIRTGRSKRRRGNRAWT